MILKRLIFRNVEIVSRFIADNNLHLFTVAQQLDDISYQYGREVEVGGADRQLVFGTGHQVKDGFIQQARFTQAYQRGDGEFFVTSGADKMVAAVAELLTVLANVVFDFRAFGRSGLSRRLTPRP